MRARARVLGAGGLPLLFVLAAWGLAAPVALAQTTCTFDAGTATVQVTLAAGAAVSISRAGDAIAVDGVACDTATVTNTDTVQVTGTGAGQEDDLTIDLSGGPFAPGASAEGDGGDAEIEFAVDLPGGGVLRVLAGSTDDALTLGSDGANLNAGEAVGDVDVTLAGPAAWELRGGDGGDVLSLVGGDGAGDPVVGATLRGEAGDDRVLAGPGGSTLSGGEGRDTLSYAAAASVRVDLAGGLADPRGGTPDSIAAFEDLIGSRGDDILIGDGGDNRLEGLGGSDRLDGRKGDDLLKGGKGRDVLDMRLATAAVTVNLKAGTANGAGEDTLRGIEDAIGSDRRDVLIGSDGPNEFLGGGGPDEIRGGAGRDRLAGGLGNDDLEGGDDADTLEGGKGRDQLDGGDGRDTCVPGPDPDAWTSCEVLKL
jgi:Ca2+-binding RTX toxin-like protein